MRLIKNSPQCYNLAPRLIKNLLTLEIDFLGSKVAALFGKSLVLPKLELVYK
jgi:hypothetical protein